VESKKYGVIAFYSHERGFSTKVLETTAPLKIRAVTNVGNVFYFNFM
jgi:hypothetical protein